MKCRNYVRYATRRKKGSGEEYRKPVDIRSAAHFGHEHEKMLSDGYVLCDGDVACAKVQAIDEPEWGGHSAKLEVEYACGKCGNTFFPELEANSLEVEAEVAALASRGIQTITEAEQDERRARWVKARGMPA